ncbi:MAG: hypothetical protein DMF98_04965 [Acidobacteria bacterium]|nr:MAG: hypothetical protein DMF98_04965 [Acidobacteriota bacterium]
MVQGANGWYVFSDLAAFEARRPDSFRRASGVEPRIFATTRTGAFVSDHVTASGSLTLDAGVRLDVVTWPSPVSIAQRQVEPRVGFAWSPLAAWVVRTGAGIFADRIPLAALDRVLAMNGVSGVEEILEPPAASAAPSICTVRSGAWHPSSRQTSIGIERLLTSDLTVSANYLFVHGVDLPRTVNVGLANAMFELQPAGESSYHGLSLAANRRLSHEIAWSASYTWSRALDTASDFDEQPQNPLALHEEWGRFRYDQPHRLVANALFDLPIGDEEDRISGPTPDWWVRALSNIEAATILTVSSGQPVNPITGSDDLHTLSFPLVVRPPGALRNSLRLPAFAAADVRLLKAIAIKPHGKLDLVVEAFNILNRQNVIGIDPVFGPGPSPRPGFGRAIEAANPRHIQFSIDVEF